VAPRGYNPPKLLGRIAKFQPDIMVMQIGCNDLDEPGAKPESVGYKISEFTDYLQSQFQIPKIVVCQLIPRRRCRHGSIESYNSRVHTCNQYLYHVIGDAGPEFLAPQGVLERPGYLPAWHIRCILTSWACSNCTRATVRSSSIRSNTSMTR
jgi:hypothetical protein